MGEVYRARDTRLDRTVAIKVLPSHVMGDPTLRERFEREARTIAALNHSNICTLHDVGHQDGIDFLVMEFVDGQTLAQRLEAGRPLPLMETLAIAMQIADALDKAHRQGIVHRDLKPANVMLTKSGAKLLDFGLAKRTAPAASLSSVSALPTEAASNLTGQGTILGTFQYMAPEQLEGREADTRGDIWAFGAVLCEMLTGRKAFEGRSHVSLIAAILEHEPRLTAVRPPLPAALDHVVRICLAKNPDERWQSIGDVRRELAWIAQSGAESLHVAEVATPGRHWRELVAWSVAALSLTLALVAGALWSSNAGRAIAPALLRLTVNVPEAAPAAFAVLSPDGRQLAFLGPLTVDGRRRTVIWVRRLDASDDRSLADTVGAYLPFWSADGRSIGFFAQQKLKRIDLDSGLVQTVCDAPNGRGGAWNEDTIVFAPNLESPLMRVTPRAGSTPTALTHLNRSTHEMSHRLPTFTPDGRHVVFTVLDDRGQNNLSVVSLDSSPPRVLMAAAGLATQAQAVAGHVLFVRDGSLFAQAIDRGLTRLSGEPILLAPDVASDDYSWQAFAASERGQLIVRDAGKPPERQLTWFSRAGATLGTVWEPVSLRGFIGMPFTLSPDERRVAAFRDEPTSGRTLWIVDLTRNTASILAREVGQENMKAVWSRDGSRIVFGRAHRFGAEDLYVRRADGSSDQESVVESGSSRPDMGNRIPLGWTPDDSLLFAEVDLTRNVYDLWTRPVGGSGTPSPSLRVGTGGTISTSQIAVTTDGRWVAYISTESGRPQIHVSSLTGTPSAQVTQDAGRIPAWKADGSELYYVSSGKLVALPVRLGTAIDLGAPKVLFDLPPLSYFQPSRDGQRFLIAVPQTPATPPPPSFTVFVNWQALLDKRK